MSVHIYVSGKQPLTHYNLGGPTGDEWWVDVDPDEPYQCDDCGRMVAARDLSIQVYYDCSHITCTEKEYGRAPEFPFEYRHVCKGTARKK